MSALLPLVALDRDERSKPSIRVQRELSPSLALERLLERLLGSVLNLLEAERGVVLLLREDGAMDIAARRNLADAELMASGFSGSVGATERALATARTASVADAVCVPLVAVDRLIGLIYADSRKPGTSFGALDVEILEALAAHAALAIVMARVGIDLKGLAARLPDAAVGLARPCAIVVGAAGALAHRAARATERAR